MKKLIYSSLVLLGASFASCGDDLLTETNLKDSTVDGFYTSQTDIDRALVGVYTELYSPDGSAVNNEVMMANLASDEMFAGGEPGGDLIAKAIDGFKREGEDMFNPVWNSSYRAIYRSALIIENINKAAYDNEDARNQDLGEAYFLRAHNYFRLAKFFGGVPLMKTSIEHQTVSDRVSLDEIYAFIAGELVRAIEVMPSNKYMGPDADYGKVNKWIAEAYLARVYLFYTGYKTNMLGQATTELPVDGGTTLTKSEIVAYLDDCIANSGYALEPDFRSLWPYSKAGSDGFYPWAADAKWDGDGSTLGATSNTEKMFVVRHGKGFWDKSNQKISNMLCLFQGVRDLDTENVPFGPGGWGWCTVSKTVADEIYSDPASDIRSKGSIINYDDTDDMAAGYKKSGDQVTGLANKKYTQIAWKDETGVYQEMWQTLFKGGTDKQINDLQDLILLRYSDVLLMHSELTATNTGMNLVRARVGLSAIAYSDENLRLERRREFVFEGVRWFDELRWGTIEADLAKVNNELVLSKGVQVKYNVTFNKEAKGLWPIPESQIRVTGGLYKQNPGW